MRFSTPLRTSVVKRGEKEQRLGAFIASHFARVQDREITGFHEVLLLARSIDSPVVKAVVSSALPIASAGRSVRMILANADREAMPSDWFLPDAPRVDCEVRWARNRRLLEAHEQLVLGPGSCWIGDSMRRDPSKCDAYETFVESDAGSAASARVSFERLWAAAELVVPSALPLPAPFVPASVVRPN
jgi:hypothetical protein